MKNALLLLGALIACNSDTTTKTFNASPEVVIMSHSDGFEAIEGELISFRAQVSDTNDPFEELRVAWYWGQNLVCEWATPNEGGDAYCDLIIGGSDELLRVEVQDLRGGAGRAEINVEVTPNLAPEAEILSPQSADRLYSDQLISFHGFVSDLEDSPEDLLLQWESSIDGELVVATVADSNGDAREAGFLSEGQHSLQLHVTDTLGKSVTESVVLQVGGANNPPSCAITAPADQSGSPVGDPVIFRGTATDPDVGSNELTISWISDKDGALGAGSIDSAGELSFPYAGLSADTHTITLEVLDEVGEYCSDTIILSVGSAPEISLYAPLTGDLYQLNESISFDAVVTDSDEISSQLSIAWESDLDGVFSQQPSDSNGILSFNKSTLSAGNHSVTLTVTDSYGLVTTENIDFMINTLPTAPTVMVSPVDPTTTESLLVTATGSQDPDGHSLTYVYSWYLNGSLTSHTTSAVSSADTTKGEVWTARVAATDGYHEGSFSETSVVIRNSPPSVSGTTISPTSPNDSDLLTCTAISTDDDAETLVETIVWTNLSSGVVLGTGGSLQLSPNSAADGDVIQCTLEVADSDVSVLTTASVTVLNTAPFFTSAAELTPASGITTTSVLSCSGMAVDTDGSLPALTYSWINITTGTTLGASSSVALTTATSSPSDIISCIITATDLDGESVDSSVSVSVENSPPEVALISFSPASGITTADTVTCSAVVSDPDDELVAPSYLWLNGATGTTLGVGATLSLNASMIQPTEELICEVSVSDGYGATTIQNGSLLVENTLPAISSSSVTPQNPYNDETLSCAVNATDADGQSLSESFIWSNISSGVVIGSGSQLTLSSLLGMPGDLIECTATVNDGTGGESSDSSLVMIGNRPPNTPSLAIRPNPANTLSSLECLINSAADPDGQSVSVSFAWYVNSILQPAETAQIYGGAMSAGDNVACTVISSDGQLLSQLGSASIVIANSPPTIDSLLLTPVPLTTAEALTATVVYSDADGDSVNLNYIWSVNGIVIQSGANNALTSAIYVRGDFVSVSVTPSDMSSSGAAATASLSVVNSPPESQVPVLTPATPFEGADDLLCSVSGGFDADGDSISFNFAWLVDGIPFSGSIDTATSSIVPAMNTFNGELWECLVTAHDGIDNGIVVSASVTIDVPWPGLITFSSCGQTGRTGPTQSMCDLAYAGEPHSGLVSVSSGFQYWTAPSTATYLVEAVGAGETFGLGAYISGEVALNAGDVLKIAVGQQGELGGGGHGGSFVALDDDTPILVAGGGAGVGDCTIMTQYANASISTSGHTGNVGSGGSAGNGGNATNLHTHGGGGGGGFYTNGTENSNFSSRGLAFFNGALGANYRASANRTGGFGGGGGGFANNGSSFTNQPAGGGGYSGGGGGGSTQYYSITGNCPHGGGGGSYNIGLNQDAISGYNNGQGLVRIDRL